MSQKVVKTKQIIEAATEEFLHKGLDAASMHNIAEKAKVSKRTLYKYYPTKDDLYNALIDEILSSIMNFHEFKYYKDKSIKEQIEDIIDAKIELTLDDSFINISKILVGGLFKGRKPLQEQMDKMYASEQEFVKWIEEAQRDKKLVSDMKAFDIASQFHSTIKGQIFWPVMMGMKSKESIDRNKVKEITTRVFVSSFCV